MKGGGWGGEGCASKSAVLGLQLLDFPEGAPREVCCPCFSIVDLLS